MMTNGPGNQSELYLDFSQFNELRKMSRDDKTQALRETAKQMEGVFLDMMMQSMRNANAAFGEGNMTESKDAQYYQSMYDKQLVNDISNRGGLGLADIIVRQLSRQNGLDADNVVERSYDISGYLNARVPSRQKTDQSASQMDSDSMVHQAAHTSTAQPGLNSGNLSSSAKISWESPEQFIEAILPFAEKASRSLSVEPEAIVAQAILETGWGKHVMQDGQGESSFNFFGIKADSRWAGEVTSKNTLEYRNGIAAKERAAFRSYSTLDQAFEDYVAFLKNNSRYEDVVSKKTDAKQWGFELQQSGYATDPNYGNKIATIMDSDVFQSTIERLRKQI
ncbi:MAG: flagellar assembly peptidoglycan hydrolase FlgJ [Ketobacter sp.]|nr:MAG: flagellar assembly peptidoglycan hydrolase FlgJ [Ketobacter sp.]